MIQVHNINGSEGGFADEGYYGNLKTSPFSTDFQLEGLTVRDDNYIKLGEH